MIATPRSSLPFTALGVPHSSGQATRGNEKAPLHSRGGREIEQRAEDGQKLRYDVYDLLQEGAGLTGQKKEKTAISFDL